MKLEAIKVSYSVEGEDGVTVLTTEVYPLSVCHRYGKISSKAVVLPQGTSRSQLKSPLRRSWDGAVDCPGKGEEILLGPMEVDVIEVEAEQIATLLTVPSTSCEKFQNMSLGEVVETFITKSDFMSTWVQGQRKMSAQVLGESCIRLGTGSDEQVYVNENFQASISRGSECQLKGSPSSCIQIGTDAIVVGKFLEIANLSVAVTGIEADESDSKVFAILGPAVLVFVMLITFWVGKAQCQKPRDRESSEISIERDV